MPVDKNAPIAVFDSGMGGISVLRECVKVMPHEDFLYYGDSVHAPYGTKTLEEVQTLTVHHVQSFMNRGCKAAAIACNTATSAAVRKLRTMYPNFPIVGIEPAVKPAALAYPGGKVLVMATPMTIQQEKLHTLISKYEDKATIYPLACPGLMEFVEEDRDKSPELISFLEDLLKDYHDVDACVLGCTHYPFMKDEIQQVLGDKVEIFDGGPGTARELRRRVEEEGLLNESTSLGHVFFENSDPSEEKMELMKRLFHRD